MRSMLLMGLTGLLAVGCKNPGAEVSQAKVETPSGTTAAPEPTQVAPPDATALAIAPSNTKIGFVGAKITRSHEGGFADFTGSLELREPIDESRVELTIETASLYTDEAKLTKHLKSPDFFDVEKFPTATFRSTGIDKEGDGYNITGDLTLHGVTKRVSFPAAIRVAGDAVEAEAEFSINRHDFGLTYPGMPDDLIRDLVVIKLDVNVPREG